MEPILIGSMALALVIATAIGQLGAHGGFPLAGGRRLGHIDGLRGYLALFVMFHHFRIWLSYKVGLPWELPPVLFYTQLGKAGVGLFFMVTGCVFYPRILKGLNGNNWAAIYISRVFRIVPLLFASILAVTVIIMAETAFRPDSHYPLEVLSWLAGRQGALLGYKAGYLINAGVLWSIYFEWLFYIFLLPFCAMLRGFVGQRTWAVPTALLLGTFALYTAGLRTFQYAPLFAVGMLAFEVSARPAAAALLRTRSASIVALAAFGLAMTFFANAYDPAPMALLALFFVCVACGNSLFGLLELRGALVLGEVSFSIYVLHGIVLHLAFRNFPLEQYPIASLLGLTVVVSALSMLAFLTIERPFIALGRKVGKSLAQRLSLQRNQNALGH